MPWRTSINIPPVSHQNPIPNACRVGNVLYTSGISGRDPVSGAVPPDTETWVANTFKNLQRILDNAGATPGDVVYMAVTVNDNAVRQVLNKYWVEMFPDPESRPARHTHIEALPEQTLSIQVMAVIQGA